MSWLDALRHHGRTLLSPRARGADIDREVRFHLDLEAMQQDHAARGALSPADARLAARRRFGNPTFAREETRRMSTLGFFDTAMQDLRFALRSFRRTPAFTAVVVGTLAIGIGANTAIFSAVHALLLRPLPFREPERLMQVSMTRSRTASEPADDQIVWSMPKFFVFQDAQHAFSSLGVYSADPVTVSGGGDAEREDAEAVGGRYFQTLGVQPVIGRDFLPEEVEQAGGRRVVLLGNALWQRRYNADPAVLGRDVDVDGKPHTIVGVLPAGFAGLTGRAQLWMPITVEFPEDLKAPWDLSYSLIGRLAPGVSAARAEAEVRAKGAVVDAASPYPTNLRIGDRTSVTGRVRWGAAARPLDATRVDPVVRRSLLVLAGAVLLVLLIACANVASLFLLRAARRRREIALRLAIGAGRRRLVRQLVTESLLISFVAGAGSIAVAVAGVRVLNVLNPASTLRMQHVAGLGVVSFSSIQLDWPTLGVAALLAVLTGLVFGLAPALSATHPSIVQGLKSGTDDSSSPRGVSALSSRTVLSTLQIALAVVLLAGSGLMLRSLGRLLAVDPGFAPQQVLTMRLNIPYDRVSRDSTPVLYDRLLERLGAIPGVSAAALENCPPLNGGCNRTYASFLDRPAADSAARTLVGVHWVTPGWFALLRVPLLRGRSFGSEDRVGNRRAVIVSATAARRFWPGADPVGSPVQLGQGGFAHDTGWVVGVVGDVRYGTLDSLPSPDFYLPYAQAPQPLMMVFLRTERDPMSVAPAAQRVLREMVPQYPAYDVRTMESRVSDALVQARFGAELLAIFAGLALLLATLGVYGVISYAVSQRMREIGIRLALGASRRAVVGLVVRQGVVVAGIGTAAGVAAALGASRLLRSLLFDVAPSDPATFGVVVALLAATVLAAAAIPARRAGRTDPVVVLREE